MTKELNFSDLQRILRLLEISDKVCYIISDMSGKLKYVNEEAIRFFEIKDSRIEIKDLFADPNDWEDLKYKLGKKRTCTDLNYILKSSSNKNYWAKISVELSKAGDVFLIIKDVSDKMKRQQEIGHQRALLEKSKIEMDRIIYSASHDLRSPISSILGLLNLLNLSPSGEERNDYLMKIQSSALKLDLLVQTLGRISKNSNEILRDERINFEIVINQVKNDLSVHSNYHKITFEQSFTQNYIFYNDYERIKLVVYNLMKNCLDFIDFNKSQKLVETEFICTTEKVIIRIFDNGIGISKSTIDRVFDLFYRGSDRSKGSGLGLFESKEVVIRLGGKIKLSSEYTIGTSIEIEIPNSKKGKLINRKKALTD